MTKVKIRVTLRAKAVILYAMGEDRRTAVILFDAQDELLSERQCTACIAATAEFERCVFITGFLLLNIIEEHPKKGR